MMTINNCGLGYGMTPQPPERPRSSAGEGLSAGVGTGALALGTGTGLLYLTQKDGFKEAIRRTAPATTIGTANVGKFQQLAWATGDKLNHLGNFSKGFLGTKEGKIIAGATAATAAIFGISKAWQADQHNEQITKKLQLENNLLGATIPPMDTFF